MILFYIIQHIHSVNLNMSIEGVPSPSKDNGPRPFYERSFFLSVGVCRKVDIGNGCDASKENEDEESDSDPNREGNTPSVPPVESIYT